MKYIALVIVVMFAVVSNDDYVNAVQIESIGE
jgi:hypothetical protein